MITASLPAAAVTIDSDSISGMNNSPGSAVPLASQLSNQYLASIGVSFASESAFVAVIVHDSPPGCGLPGGCPTVSPPNIIGGVKSDGTMNYGTLIRISFFDPSNPAANGITDFVKIRGEMVPEAGASATIEAFDVNGVSLGTSNAPDSSIGLIL
jgi:hypothetical protein